MFQNDMTILEVKLKLLDQILTFLSEGSNLMALVKSYFQRSQNNFAYRKSNN